MRGLQAHCERDWSPLQMLRRMAEVVIVLTMLSARNAGADGSHNERSRV